SLCAHWVIVAALLVFAASRRPAAHWRRAAVALLIVATGTQPYLAAMVLGILLCAEISCGDTRRTKAKLCALFLAPSGFGLYSFGYFTGADLTSPGFGDYSANLLTLVDSDGWSRLLPDLPGGPGQYEGFAFLGLAPILVLAFSGVTLTWNALRGRPLFARPL